MRKIAGTVRMAGSIFCAKNLRSFRGKLAGRVRLLKSKIKSSLMTALNSLERWREILSISREDGGKKYFWLGQIRKGAK